MRTLWLLAGLLSLGAYAQTSETENLYLADDGAPNFYNMPMPESRSLKIERNFAKGEKYWLLVVSDGESEASLMTTVSDSDGKVVARAIKAEPATVVELVPEQSGTYTIQCTTDAQRSDTKVLISVYTPDKKSPKDFEAMLKFFREITAARMEVAETLSKENISMNLHSQYASIVHRGKPHTWTMDVPAGVYSVSIFVDDMKSPIRAQVVAEGGEVKEAARNPGGCSYALVLQKPTRVRVTLDANLEGSNAYASIYIDAVTHKE
ncbi:MAG: hypothetical protein WHS44_04840 [Fimbriimonadales bacterium]|nr:MAG: hypothetical protein KatS3mg018_2603 [Fimbriimonadales bacterium]